MHSDYGLKESEALVQRLRFESANHSDFAGFVDHHPETETLGLQSELSVHGRDEVLEHAVGQEFDVHRVQARDRPNGGMFAEFFDHPGDLDCVTRGEAHRKLALLQLSDETVVDGRFFSVLHAIAVNEIEEEIVSRRNLSVRVLQAHRFLRLGCCREGGCESDRSKHRVFRFRSFEK